MKPGAYPAINLILPARTADEVLESPRQNFQQLPLILGVSKEAGTPAGGVEERGWRSGALPSASVVPYSLPRRPANALVSAEGESAVSAPARPRAFGVLCPPKAGSTLPSAQAAVTRSQPVIANTRFRKCFLYTRQESVFAS